MQGTYQNQSHHKFVIQFFLQITVTWIRTEVPAGITQFGGTLICLTVVALDFGMAVVMVTKTALKLKRNVRALVLNQLKKVMLFEKTSPQVHSFIFQIGVNYQKYLDHVKGTIHNGSTTRIEKLVLNLFMVVVWATITNLKHAKSVKICV